ncbi:MAG: hypothetical protein ACREDN_09705 [Aestuariivirga sp.]
MRKISNEMLRGHFLGWQCRIRQISARDYGGQPLPAMRPRVSRRNGDVLLPAMTVLLLPEESGVSTAFFRFQALKTADPGAVRDAGINYLAGGFYQQAELFSDELTAVFAVGSKAADLMSKAREVMLDFEQFSQSFRMFCKVRKLAHKEQAREASLWQARIFNPGVASDAVVLGFKPDWKNAVASPMP